MELWETGEYHLPSWHFIRGEYRSKAELGKVESTESLGKLIFFNTKVSFTSATLCSRTNYYQITITPGGPKPHELCLFAPSALYSAGDIPVVGGSTIHPWKHSD